MTIEVSEAGAKGTAAREASRLLARLSTDVKDRALLAISRDLLEHENYILSANREDIEAGRAAGLSNAIIDRLFLSHERLEVWRCKRMKPGRRERVEPTEHPALDRNGG